MEMNDIRKLRRPQLVELVQNLQAEHEATKQELCSAQAKLQERAVAIGDSGTLAEAVCKINGVMEAADAAAEQFLENVRRQHADAEEKDRQMLDETRARCTSMEEETRRRCESMISDAKEEAQAYWDEVYARLQQYCKASDALKEFTSSQENEIAL